MKQNAKQFDIITIFPDILNSYFSESLFKRAQENKLIKIKTHFLRKWTIDRHQTVDDKPYGGGAGLVYKIEPIYKALKSIYPTLTLPFERGGKHSSKSPLLTKEGARGRLKKTRIILTAANGKRFTQADAKRLAKYDRIIFVCPRYEGVDARVEKLVDEKISIGDYVLAGGELPAAVITEAVCRYIPGFVGKQESVEFDSHSTEGYLEHPQYTRPEVFEINGKKLRVPKVLLSGHHGEVAKWREKH
jgi:tRNA (guanine37-N1)-methyltransferase